MVGYGLNTMEKECFRSIIKNTAHPYLFTYYDNQKDRYSLTELWNKLILHSPTENICLLNNDTVVMPWWLSKMYSVFELYKQKVFVGPSTNNCHSPQKSINTFENADALKHDANVELGQPVSGFCFLFNKIIWDKLGGFDEKYDFYGAESDFIDRAIRLFEYISVWAQSAFVKHIGGASIKASGKNQESERKRALKLYWNDQSRKNNEDSV